ncbi:hypothetical protein MNBD_GAMMA11-2631 [hydrothermal vent metagenome]|uniref:Uncharacterized protein n=1 Tax=hydrothermal vent metagenome TaxID=652676 RepID=A0A3B0WTE4_9ZZZZ
MLFNEFEFSRPGKQLVYLAVILAAISSIINIQQNIVIHPKSFIVVLAGFSLFILSKITNLINGHLISFGTHSMSARPANIYRSGYWLMTTGFLLTFAG